MSSGDRRIRKEDLRKKIEVKKGQLLLVKVPPYYEKEYFYEVSGAGGKLIRAQLYHSPKVKKSWTSEEFALSIEMGVIRMAREDERPQAAAAGDVPAGDSDQD